LVAFDRNRGVPAALQLPRGRVVSRGKAIQRFPGLRRQGLRGAAVWYDYETTEADRLTFAWALAAAEHGAVLANHVEATSLAIDGRRVAGIRARDRETGGDVEIGARVTVVAAGAAAGRLLAPLKLPMADAQLKAINLVTRREAGEEALGARTQSGRALFLVPWRGHALFGTWESDRETTADGTGVTEREVGAFISELNAAFPSLDLTRDDVTMVHRGIV